jgi:signal transduction histidine kinase/ActR/RegA family two-component response regulator
MMLPRIFASGVAGLLLLLAYLLIQGASPEAARHERAYALRELALNEAALQRDVLQARAGLLRNYDPLVQSVMNLRRAVDDLRAADRQASTEVRAEIDRHTERLAEAVSNQEALVESFKSSNALLQNSLSFFMHASRQFRPADGRDREAVTAAMGALANAMLRLTADPGANVAGEVVALLDRLDQIPVQEEWRESIRVLDAHGRLIVATLPTVDSLVSRLLAAPIAQRTRDLQAVYFGFYARALERANFFRALLYIAAAMLAAYVGYLLLRLHANARALHARVGFEHLIAAISAHFINLPRERIDEGVERGLARLAEHTAVDRADILIHGSDEGGPRASYAWRRIGADAPASHHDAAPASNWHLSGYEQHGCLHVPDVEKLPGSSERSFLKGQGVRSRLSAPMWYAGNRVGALTLDTTRGIKRWSADDIALVRMAGEIFATAIERKRIEAEREGLEARLHEAQRLQAVGTLAGGIAHEFNNILGAILGHCEMALAALAKSGRARRHVQQAMKAGQRAATVIDQVLTFSRRREPRRRPIVVEPVVAEAIELLRASLPATISIEASLNADDTRIEGDPSQLQQVVMNLCTNATQAMDGRGTIEIELEPVEAPVSRPLSHGALAAGRHARLAVTDAGHGIDSATMQRMFEPFFTTKAAGSGTGLGLPTVHGIVTEHHGVINVESAAGAGTRFEVYFPQTEASAASEEAGEAATPSGHGETILLVDDEESLVSLGEEMLATLGYEPVGFHSGATALEAFRADPKRFDLALTDEVMPGMTGSELAQALHQLRPELPIVLMTGYAGPVEVDHVHAAGISEVIKKPLLTGAISQCLARHLNGGPCS